MAIKENVLPLAQNSGSGTYIRTLSSGGESQRTSFDIVKGAITADMDDAIEAEAEARETADTQLETELNSKVDKVTGKGLSTNDFTNALKTKLDGIEAGAEVNVIETVKVNGTALVPDTNRAVNVPAPTVDSALSTTSENPVQNKIITGAVNGIQDELADKPNWTVGSAEQILSDEASQTDTTPYTFRRSGGGLIPFNFTREELSKVVGGTVAWNQLERFDRAQETAYGVTGQNSNGVSTINGTATNNGAFLPSNTGTSIEAIVGHKYIAISNIVNPSTNRLCAGIYIGGTLKLMNGTSNIIYNHESGSGKIQIGYRFASGTTFNNEQIKGGLIDLTAMLGTTIADYIYSLETATAGSGIAKLREWGFFRDSYYSYDPGSLQSVCVGAHEMRDADDNVIGNYALDSTKTLRGRFYLDSNNQLRADGDIYLPSGEVSERYGEVDLGSLLWFASEGATYFYSAVIPTAIQSGLSAFVCSKYVYSSESISTVASGYGRMFNGRVYIKDTAYTSASDFKTAVTGTKLVYEKATPTTETADPYTAIQICDSDGTEEFVDALVEAGTRDVAIPAGTETTYFEDMAGKLAEMPTIPKPPTTDGTYTLKATVSGGVATISWTS